MLLASAPSQAELTANASVTNNYLWRGLTQSINEAAVQGGVDYASESGFYAGTWTSNVSYDSDDAYSYEHDMYFGFAGEASGFSYDLGYLYFSATLWLLATAEPSEGPGQDFGFAEASYTSLNYTIPLASGAEVGLHAGYHDGDFADAFNGITDGYMDFNITLAKDGFTFMISDTTLGTDDDGDGVEDYASMSTRDNDEIKFVVSYGVDFTL
jgi:hypothetical protein